VGFDLYCQLLRRTVAAVQGEAPPVLAEVELKLDFLDYATGQADEDNAAVLPAEYIEDETLRVGAYHRIAACTLETEIDEVEQELADRFGPIPPALRRLLTLARIRCAAAAQGVTRIETREAKIMMSRGQDYIMFAQRFPRFSTEEPDGKLKELLEKARAPEEAG
jgi:transcription-repair coupling factor (superfamily II helicase)